MQYLFNYEQCLQQDVLPAQNFCSVWFWTFGVTFLYVGETFVTHNLFSGLATWIVDHISICAE